MLIISKGLKVARPNKEEELVRTSLTYPLNKNFILRKKKSIKKILLNNKYLVEFF
jgi:hypothetical protein